MAFFRTVSFSEQLPAIMGNSVLLRAPQMSDYAEWASLRDASRDFLTPWEPTWPADDLTRAAFRRRIKRYTEDQRGDLAYPFFIVRRSDQVLVGGLTLSNIRRGCAQAGSLGYWMGAPYASRGYMTAAVIALIPFAFGTGFEDDSILPGHLRGIPRLVKPYETDGVSRLLTSLSKLQEGAQAG